MLSAQWSIQYWLDRTIVCNAIVQKKFNTFLHYINLVTKMECVIHKCKTIFKGNHRTLFRNRFSDVPTICSNVIVTVEAKLQGNVSLRKEIINL